MGEYVLTDRVADRSEIIELRFAFCAFTDSYSFIQSEPTHNLRVCIVTGRRPRLPYTVVRFLPASCHSQCEIMYQTDMPIGDHVRAFREHGDERHNGSKDIELDLHGCGVADTHRSAPRIPRQLSDNCFVGHFFAVDGIDRRQRLRARTPSDHAG